MISEPVSETHYFIKKLDDGQRQREKFMSVSVNYVFHMVVRAMSEFFSPKLRQLTVIIVQMEFVLSEERN
jgi:hypothetical protein